MTVLSRAVSTPSRPRHRLGAGVVIAAVVVLSADQSEGADVPVGTNVNLTVATGKVVLNDVTGYLLTAAKSELEDAGLTVVETADAGCPAAPGDPLVESQSLPPGEVAIHSEITLTYCTG